MSASVKQLLALLLAGILLFYKPKSQFEVIIGIVFGIVLLVISASSIKEHRKKNKKK